MPVLSKVKMVFDVDFEAFMSVKGKGMEIEKYRQEKSSSFWQKQKEVKGATFGKGGWSTSGRVLHVCEYVGGPWDVEYQFLSWP